MLHKKPAERVAALAALEGTERLRLAVPGAGAAIFDWTVADDRIAWDGALDVLTLHTDPDRLRHGATLRAWMSRAGREHLDAVITEIAYKERLFEFEFEAASAMGAVWFEMRGVRVPGAGGNAERLAGTVHVVTERRREAHRLTYLATRDELTGHLNRTSLRGEP